MGISLSSDDVPPRKTIRAPCGETAYFDVESGYAYRCGACFAVIGSVGMPDRCRTRAGEGTGRQ